MRILAPGGVRLYLKSFFYHSFLRTQKKHRSAPSTGHLCAAIRLPCIRKGQAVLIGLSGIAVYEHTNPFIAIIVNDLHT